MKNSIILCFSLMLCVFGCDEVNKNPEVLEFENSFESVGIYHNEMLNEMYSEFGSLIGSKSSKTKHLSFSKEFVYKKANESKTDISNLKFYIEDLYNFHNSNKRLKSNANNFDLRGIFESINVSDEAKQFLYKIADYSDEVASYEINHDQLKIKLSTLEKEANDSLTKIEAELVLKTSSVFYYSSLYWKENLDKWVELLKKPISEINQKNWFKRMVRLLSGRIFMKLILQG